MNGRAISVRFSIGGNFWTSGTVRESRFFGCVSFLIDEGLKRSSGNFGTSTTMNGRTNTTLSWYYFCFSLEKTLISFGKIRRSGKPLGMHFLIDKDRIVSVFQVSLSLTEMDYSLVLIFSKVDSLRPLSPSFLYSEPSIVRHSGVRR